GRARRARSGRGPCPAAQDERQHRAGDENESRGYEVAQPVEPALGGGHEDGYPAFAHELIENLWAGPPLLRQLDHTPVHCRTDGAGEVGSAACIDVEVATAGAMDLLLDRLDRGVVVGSRDRGEGPARSRRIPDAPGRTGARKRSLGGSAVGREGGDRSGDDRREKLPPSAHRRTAIPQY